MGRNSKARRDARRRKAPSPRPGGASGSPREPAGPGGDGLGRGGRPSRSGSGSTHDDLTLAEEAVVTEASLMAGHPPRRQDLRLHVDRMTRYGRLPSSMIADALSDLVARLVEACRGGRWSDDDLREIGRRRLDGDSRARLEGWLTSGRRPGCSADREELASELAVAGLLAGLPALPEMAPPRPTPRGDGGPGGGPDGVEGAGDELTRKLATVRGLLAKAESTQFDEEAEALTAKAQELISRYALESLLAQAEEGGEPDVVTLRLWLDAPYVDAKASLVHHVAQANRCRAIQLGSLDLCLVVGAATDLAYVELLVTSLLVQAEQALGRHGRHVDRSGASRTRSFRQSFLVAFAVRVGQRLVEATSETVGGLPADRAGADRLLPVIRAQEERVSARFDELFPDTVSRSTSISNPAGYHAGQVAADLAQLDVHAPVTPAEAG